MYRFFGSDTDFGVLLRAQASVHVIEGLQRYGQIRSNENTKTNISENYKCTCVPSPMQLVPTHSVRLHFRLQARVTVRKDTAWHLFIHCQQPLISSTLLAHSQQKVRSLKLLSFSSPAARHSSTEAHLESKVPIARLIAVRVGVGSVRGICMQTNQTCIDHVRRTCADYC